MGKDSAQTKQLMDIALNAGVNCMDLYSPNPDMRSNIGMALKGKRKNFIFQAHICSIWKDGQYKRTRVLSEIEEGFEDLLTRLQTDYIDIGMIHYVDAEKDWDEICNGGVMQYAKELKAQGKIHYIGMSSHNPAVSLKAVNSGLIDVLMFSINPCYDLLPATEDIEVLFDERSYEKTLLNMEPEREALYEACQRLGIGITVMKAFGGGDLLDEALSPAGKALTPCQCLHYALTLSLIHIFENLFVAGEAVGGIHGRNRLMGNSLLDIIVFGRSAGKNAAAKSQHTKTGELTLSHVHKFAKEMEEAGIHSEIVSPKLLPDYTRKRNTL